MYPITQSMDFSVEHSNIKIFVDCSQTRAIKLFIKVWMCVFSNSHLLRPSFPTNTTLWELIAPSSEMLNYVVKAFDLGFQHWEYCRWTKNDDEILVWVATACGPLTLDQNLDSLASSDTLNYCRYKVESAL